MSAFSTCNRIVVKIGSSTLTHEEGHLNLRRIEALVKTLSDFKNGGKQVVLVSSGAVSAGVAKMGTHRPTCTAEKQAMAAIGQSELMKLYDRFFSDYGHTVAQILLTAEDLRQEKRHLNFENTMKRLLEMQVLPIINENDTVATEEIEIGDNDTLAAIVAVSVKADLLVLLSDIDGLYTADPHKDANARLISRVEKLDEKIMALGGGKGSSLGTGGMQTKLHAAKIATEAGCDMIIANGSSPEHLYDIFAGEEVGTRFCAVK